MDNKAYGYTSETKEFTCIVPCQLDPRRSEREGKEYYLLPANATWIEPNKPKGKYTQIFDIEAEKWNYIEDNRGVEYWNIDDVYGTPPQVMKELGPLPKNTTTVPPEKPIPTVEEMNEEIRKQRERYYRDKSDPLISRRDRKKALNKWSDEDEQEFIADMERITQEVEDKFPYIIVTE